MAATPPSPQKEVLLARIFRANTTELRAIAQGYGIKGVNPEFLMTAKNQMKDVVNKWSAEDFLERHNSYVTYINGLKGADREAALGYMRKPAAAAPAKLTFSAPPTGAQPMKTVARSPASPKSPPVTDSVQLNKVHMEQLVAAGAAATAEIDKTLQNLNSSLAESVAANHALREVITAEISRLQQAQTRLINSVTQQKNDAMLQINIITTTILGLMDLHAKLCSSSLK